MSAVVGAPSACPQRRRSEAHLTARTVATRASLARAPRRTAPTPRTVRAVGAGAGPREGPHRKVTKETNQPQPALGRRQSLALGSAASLMLLVEGYPYGTLAAETYGALELGEYANDKDGYKLNYPKDWKVSSKAGASVLYEDPAQKYNTVGVLVYPVRIQNLQQFGTIDFAASKLLDVEKKKEITRSTRMLSTREFELASGTAYQIEYEVETDYGLKTNVALVTVNNGKLYNLNVQYGQSGYYGVASPEFISSIRQILDSFTLI